MADAKPIAPIRIGGTDIHYAQGMRAGPWLFFTGHEASDFERGIATVVAGKPGLPLDGQARYRREADYVLARLAKLIDDINDADDEATAKPAKKQPTPASVHQAKGAPRR